jgi:hypothetical protein
MRSRPFYVVTCALAVAAVVLTGASKVVAGRVATSAARATEAHTGEEREALRAAAHVYAARSDLLWGVAAVAFVSAIVGWGCSLWRREGGLQSVPLVLLIFAGLLQLLMV